MIFAPSASGRSRPIALANSDRSLSRPPQEHFAAGADFDQGVCAAGDPGEEDRVFGFSGSVQLYRFLLFIGIQRIPCVILPFSKNAKIPIFLATIDRNFCSVPPVAAMGCRERDRA